MCKGFERGKDGILRETSHGRHYSEPPEAAKFWYKGKLRLGCTAEVVEGYRSHPCRNAAKHAPDANGNPTRCGIHSPEAEARREAKRQELFREHTAATDRKKAQYALQRDAIRIIERIASGHNDPMALCKDWMRRRDSGL